MDLSEPPVARAFTLTHDTQRRDNIRGGQICNRDSWRRLSREVSNPEGRSATLP